MLYETARQKIRSGDLLSWTHRGWGSFYDLQIQFVRIVRRTEHSHVGIAWVIGSRVFVIEAVGAGVRLFPLSRSVPFYWLGICAPWKSTTEEFALSHIGEQYSKWECIKGYFKPLVQNGRWQCAKLVLAVMREDGIYLGESAIPDDVVRVAMDRYDAVLVSVGV